ncbi:MAG: hypothetical protein HYX53_01920 [Chloroflexi bacterium]|nr:hypothetical protein [Chloroflexota bacterium]
MAKAVRRLDTFRKGSLREVRIIASALSTRGPAAGGCHPPGAIVHVHPILTPSGRCGRSRTTRPVYPRPHAESMAPAVAYDEETYDTADGCLLAIKEHVEKGWLVMQIRGPHNGPFLVAYRMDGDAR